MDDQTPPALIKRAEEIRLKFEIRDTSLISALRQISFIGESTKKVTSVSQKTQTTEVIFGNFVPNNSFLTFSGVIHNRFRVNFRVHAETRTYREIISFLYAQCASSFVRSSLKNASAADKELILSSLRNEQHQLDGESPARDRKSPIAVYPEDFQVIDDDPFDLVLREQEFAAIRKRKSSRTTQQGNVSPRSILRNRRFRVFDRSSTESAIVPATIILSLEKAPTSVKLKSAGRSLRSSTSLEQDFARAENFRFLCTPDIKIKTDCVEASVEVETSAETLEALECYLRWGRYGDSDSLWVDEQLFPEDFTRTNQNIYRVTKTISPHHAGQYGVTFYVRYANHGKKYWLGRPYIDDGQFYLENGFPNSSPQNQLIEQISHLSFQTELIQSMLSFESFVKTIEGLSKEKLCRGLGRALFEITRDDEGLRALLSEYYELALRHLSEEHESSEKRLYQLVTTTLQNIGIGEIVFIAPEGPHANAGGLGQVIIGLMQSLNRTGISTTLITPLYEQSQGNKHTSAAKLLREGLTINNRKVPLGLIGNVEVVFGPTRFSGTSLIKEHAQTIAVQVYLAEYENVKIFFLRHKRYASKLYSAGSSEELLRRAIFLSRGALELLSNPRFGVRPHILITNDWLTGLVPVFLKTDPKYSFGQQLHGVETAHILHNCGRAYQGRLFVNQYGEDLWPILGLSDEHFFGLCDPHDRNYFNLTAGAIFHVERALVAVSKPYAEELFTKEGGEGLHEMLQKKSKVLFGISNGVDMQSLHHVLWELGESARSVFEQNTNTPEHYSQERLLLRLPSYKEALKRNVQRKSGLAENQEAVLISLVGRLAEQKGIGLLTQKIEKENCTVLELILRTHRQTQLIIAGPPSEGDPAFLRLVTTLRDLAKRYPNRIQGIFDFVTHGEALEITGASDLFLMPSRYEPGGITQLEALATGTLVVARNVGGISATLVDYGKNTDLGNAFLFEEYTPEAFLRAIVRGIEVAGDRKMRDHLMLKAAVSENDWTHRAPKYLSLLQHVAGVFSKGDLYPHLSSRRTLLSSIRPDQEKRIITTPLP